MVCLRRTVSRERYIFVKAKLDLGFLVLLVGALKLHHRCPLRYNYNSMNDFGRVATLESRNGLHTPDAGLTRSAVKGTLSVIPSAASRPASPHSPGLRLALMAARGDDVWKNARNNGWRRSSYKDEARKLIHDHVGPAKASMGPTARRLSMIPAANLSELTAQETQARARLLEIKKIKLRKAYIAQRGGPGVSVMAKNYSKRRDEMRSSIAEHLKKREEEAVARSVRSATAKDRVKARELCRKKADKASRDPWAVVSRPLGDKC